MGENTSSVNIATLLSPIRDEGYESRVSSAWIFISLTLLVICAIIVGNSLVCIAVATKRSLNAVQNRFLVSLAIADLTVGVLIMPMGLVNQLLGYWVFGGSLCQLWKVFDVLACTASIWNLCLIAVDRYYCITRAVSYNAWRTPRRVNVMIILVWVLSICISVPPLVGWRADQSPEGKFKCLISDDVGYILFSTMGSFYIPALIMIVIYAKVWRAAKFRARSNSNSLGIGGQTKGVAKTGYLKSNRNNICNRKERIDFRGCDQRRQDNLPSGNSILCNGNEEDVNDKMNYPGGQSEVSNSRDVRVNNYLTASDHAKRRLAQKRERRATLVLGIIMGTFLACWYPFFQLYVIAALCGEACNIPTLLFDIIFWVGYCNSALNPIIYTVFNRDFRHAFATILKKLMCQSRN